MEHGLAVGSITTLALLLVTIAVAVASKYIRLPYTVTLVVAGLIIAFTPFKLGIDLTPDLILLIFLPALLFESSYNLHFADVRDNLRPIALLSVPGVLLTATSVAVAMFYTAGVNWETAFLFGAIVAATDPVSVLAIFRQIAAPRRLSVILEGESLFNDGTALVLFRIVLGVVFSATMADPLSTVGQFVVVVLGALALGAAVGYLVSLLLARVNDYLIETTFTLVVAYGTYLLAEEVGVSGVIATVVAALTLGNYGRSAMSPTTRLAVSSTWEFFGFLANSLIFLLIGTQLNIEKLAQYWLPTLIAIVSVLAVRGLVVLASSWVLRFIHRPIPFRWQSVLVWGGLRGAVAMAMALSLPLTLQNGQPFPNRDLLQVMTFGVILFSLLVQALTMQPLLRRLGLMQGSLPLEEFEAIGVRRGMAAAALKEVERMSVVGDLAPDIAADLKQQYATQVETLDANLRNLHLRDEDLRRERVRAAKRRLIQIEKNVVRDRYLEGVISEEPMRRLLVDLDEQLHALDEGEEVIVGGEVAGAVGLRD